jgi:hypothetical protein
MQKNSPFTNEDYNSGDGMMTSIWGPALWLSLHTISFNYPIEPTEEQKKYYYKYFKSLQYILPCRYCRENYEKNLKTHNLTKAVMKNRESLSRWVYELHEMVNKNLGKSSEKLVNTVFRKFRILENFGNCSFKNYPKITKKLC